VKILKPGKKLSSNLARTGKVGLVALAALLVCFLYPVVRGGFYPSYAAANFSNLSPSVEAVAPASLVAQTRAGALRGAGSSFDGDRCPLDIQVIYMFT
jgi:hypothetical protein